MNCLNCGTPSNPDDHFCNNCGAQLPNQNPQTEDANGINNDNVPPVMQKPEKSKGKIKIIVAAIVAVVIIIGAVLMFKSMGASDKIKIFNALKKTVFESSEIAADGRLENDYDDAVLFKGSIKIGESLNDTLFEGEVSDRYDSYAISYKSGLVSFFEDGYSDEEEIAYLLEDIEEELSYELGKDFDLESIIDSILNGKIDEKAIEDYFNATIAPEIEAWCAYEDIIIEIPNYQEFMDFIVDFLENGVSDRALTLEKSGNSYMFSLDLRRLILDFTEYLATSKDFEKVVKPAVEDSDSDFESYEEFLEVIIEEIKDEAEWLDVEFTGEIIIDSGRITYFNCDIIDKNDISYVSKIEVDIESK